MRVSPTFLLSSHILASALIHRSMRTRHMTVMLLYVSSILNSCSCIHAMSVEQSQAAHYRKASKLRNQVPRSPSYALSGQASGCPDSLFTPRLSLLPVHVICNTSLFFPAWLTRASDKAGHRHVSPPGQLQFKMRTRVGPGKNACPCLRSLSYQATDMDTCPSTRRLGHPCMPSYTGLDALSRQ